jgi:hypothetical protein
MEKKSKEKRLDMDVELYEKILEFSRLNRVEGRTMGERVLKGINEMYNRVSLIDSSSLVEIDEEIKKKINLFQTVGLLDERDIFKAINEALGIYVKEHKDELQQKIADL